jgi:thioredoxin-like negative regulator of GroEL
MSSSLLPVSKPTIYLQIVYALHSKYAFGLASFIRHCSDKQLASSLLVIRSKQHCFLCCFVLLSVLPLAGCGHCKSLTPEYEKAAVHLKGIVNVAAVDATQSQQLAAKYGVQGYPTIKVFGADKRSPTDYSGARTAAGITADAISQVSKLVRSRQQGSKPKAAKKDKPKASKQGSTKGNSSSGSKGSGESAGGGANGTVVKLTADNFDSTVLQSSEPWLVEFFAPCKFAVHELL